MKAFALLGVLGAACVSLPMSASAADQSYCMESSDGGGGSNIECSYETMAQCLASKIDHSSRCYPNPRAGQPSRQNQTPRG